MNSVYESYPEFWKGFDRPELKALLSRVESVRYPSQAAQLLAVKDQARTVITMEQSTLKHAAELIGLGFEHCVQADRPDFQQELLAATLMAARLEAFAHNPIPFFFTGFRDPSQAKNIDANMVLNFQGSSEKNELLQKLTTFLSKQPKLNAVNDLCIQTADEMMSNAIYSAPVDGASQHIYQDFDRSTHVWYPQGKQATLFASYSDYRVIIGVEDPFGSLEKSKFWAHLSTILEPGPLAAKRSAGGSGLGIRFMIDNAANFYVYCDKKKRTVFACGFLLKGVKANLSVNKHIHCSFR